MKLLAQSPALAGLAVMLVLLASFTATSQASEESGVQEGLRHGKLFFGGLYSTLTRLSVSLTTTGTRYFTCISAIANTATCTGRRRRRNVVSTIPGASLEPRQLGPVPVFSSLGSQAEANVLTNSELRDPKKLFLTIFTTTTSTVTLGTYFSDTGTTISLSVACFDPSFSFPPTC